MMSFFFLIQLCLLVCKMRSVEGDIYQNVLDKLHKDWSDPRIPKGSFASKIIPETESSIEDESDAKNTKQTVLRGDTEDLSSLNKNVDVKQLKAKVTNYETKLETLEKLNKEMEDKLKSYQADFQEIERKGASGLVFFKHFIRIFISHFEGLDFDVNRVGVKVLMNKERYEMLKNILSNNDANPKELLDFLEDNAEFKSLDPTKNMFADLTASIDLTVILFVTCGVAFSCLAAFLMKQLLFYGVNWRKLVVIVIFGGFIASVPWEWYRMYRVAYSKKASNSMKEIPIECNPKDLSVWKSVSLYFKSAFTFNSDICAKYHEDILVDPFWEVSPLQATSVCLSRFFFEPMKYFSSAIGESFRLLFQEIPVQWQPFIFLAIFFCVITVIISIFGLKIRTPLIDINVNPTPEVQYIQNQKPMAINDSTNVPNAPQIAESTGHTVKPQIKAKEDEQISNISPVSIESVQENTEYSTNPQVRQIDSMVQNQNYLELRCRKPRAGDDIFVDNIGMNYMEPSTSSSNSHNSRVSDSQMERLENENLDNSTDIVTDLTRLTLADSKPKNRLEVVQESSPPTSIAHEAPENELPSTIPSQRMEVQEVISSIKLMLTDRSSSNLVPDFSSVFDIPLSGTRQSVYEVSESPMNFHATQSTLSTTISQSVETMGVKNEKSNDVEDEDYLVVNNE